MSVQDPASEPLESQYFANSQGSHDRSRGNSLLATRYRRFFLYMNGLRPVSIHMGFMPNHVLLKREHAFVCVKKKQSKHIIN